MALPPIVQWWNDTETAQQSQWDAGIVDAGSESTTTVFHLWNNRGNSVEVADMINVGLTVRDINGQTLDLSVSGQTEAIVKAQFFDFSKGGTGQWGSMLNGVWSSDEWASLKFDIVHPVVSASGLVQRVKGTANSGSQATDRANYSKIKLKLYAKPTASAGEVKWLTRISYQYS